jgi:hypothetical protein
MFLIINFKYYNNILGKIKAKKIFYMLGSKDVRLFLTRLLSCHARLRQADCREWVKRSFCIGKEPASVV